MAEQVPESSQRWTAKGADPEGKSAKEAARKHGLEVGEIDAWKNRFLWRRCGEKS